MDSNKIADKAGSTAPPAVGTEGPTNDFGPHPSPHGAVTLQGPELNSTPTDLPKLFANGPLTTTTGVIDYSRVAYGTSDHFGFNTPIILALHPESIAYERLLGSLPNETITAFARRCELVPGMPTSMRVATQAWTYGRVSPVDAGVAAALGHLVDPRVRTLNFYDMRPLGIDLREIQYGEFYSQRVYGITTNTSDIAVLPDNMPQEGVDALVRLRRQAGLPIPYTIKESDFRKYRADLERDMGPTQMFMRDDEHVDQRSVQWGKVLNNKLDGVNICFRQGVPVPPTYHNAIAGKVDYARIPDNQPLILKAEYSAGGSGVKFVADKEDLKVRLRHLLPTDRVQVQKFIPGEDISFLFHCGEDGATLISSSTQEMENGVSHVGNAIPGDRHRIRAEFARAMKPFADFAQRVGFRGHLGIDARIGNDGKIYFIECNPRRTAVSTPTVIATQLGFPEFCHRQMVFKDKASLDAVLDRVAYKAGGKRGVVITTYLGEPGKKYKSEFVFLDRGRDGTKLRDEIIRWAKQRGYLYEADEKH